MTTDCIATQTYNLRLRSSWEADENYDFNHFHTPDCKRNECDGSCGLKNRKALRDQIKLRMAKERQRQERDKQGEEDAKTKLAEKGEELKRRMFTVTTSSGTAGEVEEPGDTDFVTGAMIRKKKTSAHSTPSKRKKARVTFAEEDVRISG
ncbi:MAG: hypothetical protein Q9221_006054 [Calogaya cf. arnoldii]